MKCEKCGLKKGPNEKIFLLSQRIENSLKSTRDNIGQLNTIVRSSDNSSAKNLFPKFYSSWKQAIDIITRIRDSGME